MSWIHLARTVASRSTIRRNAAAAAAATSALVFAAEGNKKEPRNTAICDSESYSIFGALKNLRKHQTVEKLNVLATHDRTIEDTYDLGKALGEGGFGKVYLATDKSTQEKFALKKIPKKIIDAETFQREMDAMLKLKSFGGHPNICGLREHFDDGKHYSLVLDLVEGGELFDHLIDNGAYSEADAARLVREVASALDFIHGIGIVHSDLKPENLMLNSKNRSNAVIKLVDFGCANVAEDGNWDIVSGGTTAYLPPECFVRGAKVDPAMDMWALGCIIYIMLVGAHPFDLRGNASDAELQNRIVNKAPPLVKTKLTKHLSPSAIELLQKLFARNPKERMTAYELLRHPWTRGATARTDVMAGSDKRLQQFRKYKSRIEAKVFEDFITWSDRVSKGSAVDDQSSPGGSLIERAFRSFDSEGKGFLTVDDLEGSEGNGSGDKEKGSLSLSGFAKLLGENMKNRYYPKGHVIIKEGDEGDSMYFINSGTVTVSTKSGFRKELRQGDSFGEGALLEPGKARNATAECMTPVHLIEVNKDFFQKYLSESDLILRLKEKDKTRTFDRAKIILDKQEDLKTMSIKKGESVYDERDQNDDAFILEEGDMEARAKGQSVYSVHAGEFFNERHLVLGKPSNVAYVCTSDACTVKSMSEQQFQSMLEAAPAMEHSLRDLCLRREFQKAIVQKTKKSFPSADHLRDAFDAVDTDGSGSIDKDEMRELLKLLDYPMTEKEIDEVIATVDLDANGNISFDEFKEIFGQK